MKTASWVPAFVLPVALAAVTPPVWAETATAHAPQYDNTELWPHDVEKSRFYKQEWPPAPVMVWAKTNEARTRVDHRDPANWLIDGIVFDCMMAGGIRMKDPGIMTQWNVFYGRNNDAVGNALFTRLDKVVDTQVRYGDAPREIDGVLQSTKQLLEQAVEEAKRKHAARDRQP